jgi:pilus assembly protein Flp/PilA
MHLKNQRGQGLIEYLIIVALVAVAGISVMKVVGQNVHAQFANVANAIQAGHKTIKLDEIRESQYQKRDMGDFFHGSSNRSGSKDSDE